MDVSIVLVYPSCAVASPALMMLMTLRSHAVRRPCVTLRLCAALLRELLLPLHTTIKILVHYTSLLACPLAPLSSPSSHDSPLFILASSPGIPSFPLILCPSFISFFVLNHISETMGDWIVQQREAILNKPISLSDLTTSLLTDINKKRLHYKCGDKYVEAINIPPLSTTHKDSKLSGTMVFYSSYHSYHSFTLSFLL